MVREPLTNTSKKDTVPVDRTARRSTLEKRFASSGRGRQETQLSTRTEKRRAGEAGPEAVATETQQAANAVNASTPLGASAAQLFNMFVNSGNAAKDFSGIIRMLDGK